MDILASCILFNWHGFGMSHAMTASPNHPSGHLGGWATVWSVEEMLDDNIKKWTALSVPELLTMAFHTKDWKSIFAESSLKYPPPHLLPPPAHPIHTATG